MKLGLNTVSLWFSIIMVVVILSGAIALTFTNLMSDRLYGGKRVGFIIMLFAYAIYRGFRIYQNLKQNTRSEE